MTTPFNNVDMRYPRAMIIDVVLRIPQDGCHNVVWLCGVQGGPLDQVFTQRCCAYHYSSETSTNRKWPSDRHFLLCDTRIRL